MDEKKEYREGHDPDPKGPSEEVGAAEDSHKDVVSEKPRIVTAFLIVKTIDGIELVTDLPDLNMDHSVSLPELRDLTYSVSMDTQAILVARRASTMCMTSMRDPASKRARDASVIQPVGKPTLVGPNGVPR